MIIDRVNVLYIYIYYIIISYYVCHAHSFVITVMEVVSFYVGGTQSIKPSIKGVAKECLVDSR